MRLDRRWIESHIPHQGSMCLLDEVLTWDPQRISCRSGTHRLADNPMRSPQGLGIACGVEYAAQAMAIHGALAAGSAEALAPPASQMGFLASVRDVQMHALRLDDIEEDLICEATKLAGDHASALYEFVLRTARRPLLSGRASVIFDAGKHLRFHG